MHKPFIDRYAKRGRPFVAPDDEMIVKAQPLSRSLNQLSLFDAQARSIRAEIKEGLRLDLSHVIGDKIRISKADAIRFAKWILETYNASKSKR